MKTGRMVKMPDYQDRSESPFASRVLAICWVYLRGVLEDIRLDYTRFQASVKLIDTSFSFSLFVFFTLFVLRTDLFVHCEKT